MTWNFEPDKRSIAAIGLFAAIGCAHVLHNAQDAGVEPPVSLCSPAQPPNPKEVEAGKSGGLVFADFTVQADGTVTDIAPSKSAPAPDPLLFAATKKWLSQCKYKPAMLNKEAIPARTSKGVGFYSPYPIDRTDPPPLDWADAAARALTAPQIESCLPQDPPLLDSLDDSRLSVVVQRDGHAGDMRLAEHLGEEANEGYPLAELWLRTCHFTPAKTKSGEAVAVRIPLPVLFNETAAPPPDPSIRLADGTALPVPEPTSNCDLHPWPAADKRADPQPIAPIEVDYLVDSEGNASQVQLLSAARREVFHAVRRYLLACQFMPVHDEDGGALQVRVRRSFHLRSALRRKSATGPLQLIIEGDAP